MIPRLGPSAHCGWKGSPQARCHRGPPRQGRRSIFRIFAGHLFSVKPIPSGKRLHSNGKIHHAINGKIHYFDWAIFNSYVKLPEGIFSGCPLIKNGSIKLWFFFRDISMKQFENGYPYHDIFQWITKDIFHFFSMDHVSVWYLLRCSIDFNLVEALSMMIFPWESISFQSDDDWGCS